VREQHVILHLAHRGSNNLRAYARASLIHLHMPASSGKALSPWAAVFARAVLRRVASVVVNPIVMRAGVFAVSNTLPGFDFGLYSGPLWRLA
jgi:hypothetical protein